MTAFDGEPFGEFSVGCSARAQHLTAARVDVKERVLAKDDARAKPRYRQCRHVCRDDIVLIIEGNRLSLPLPPTPFPCFACLFG